MVFLHLFTFNLYVCLYLKWVSWRQHTVFWCALIACILIDMFRALMFKVIIDILELTAAMFDTVFYLLPLFSLFISLLSTLFLPFLVPIEHLIINYSIFSSFLT